MEIDKAITQGYKKEMNDNGATARDIFLTFGRSNIARRCGIRQPTTYKWERYGVPPHHVLNLSRVLDYQRTPHQIRPDLYPHPDDGLPETLRGRRRSR